MDYIHLFETNNDFLSLRMGTAYTEPWLSLTEETNKVNYNKSEYEKMFETPLTFDILSDGVVKWTDYNYGVENAKTIEYKLNDGEWTEITAASGDSAPSINVVTGDKIQFRGNNSAYSNIDGEWNSFRGTTSQFNVKGNIMSLISKENYRTAVFNSESSNVFGSLFNNCNTLMSAKYLILPATELVDSCYSWMFYNCASLVQAPALPATTLANDCYYSMFGGCTNLTTAPELPATTLASDCYFDMFNGCTSLTTTPILPATTLANSCYQMMFVGCTSLTQAPELPSTTLANFCYTGMFIGCTGLTTAPALPATTLSDYCYRYMFQNCTSLTTAPELPATTLVERCYEYMFSGCTNLNYIKCLSTDISASNCTYNWTNGVASTGTFVKNPNATSWTTGNSGIPTNWTVQDAS